ncbi:type IV pilus modification protein PilV [Acinetobacter johnsonii]|uniref:type IV pilus modification protein PilV n=1 Tax=Acinetobacter johnsonii TaxID=40214 RepID=UPI002D7F7DFB|nr:type IV pilus modification protein PilV [Acinetobacter johnsonii]
MKLSSSQQGVGMVEVLVALVILAIGALGYVMLQVRALEATAESTQRIQAINIARDLAERVRANRMGWASYQAELGATGTQTRAAATPDCATTICTASQLSDFDVDELATYATQYGMRLGMSACPGTSNRQCLFVAWGDTLAQNSTTNSSSCTNGTSYRANSSCVMMEVY